MTKHYTLSDIFEYEDKTREYCNSEGGWNLQPPTLIDLAASEPVFNTNYAEYIIFKHLYQIADYIAYETKRKGCQINVTHTQNLKEDLENNNASKEYYEGWFRRYEENNDQSAVDPIFPIIDQALFDNNWNFLYYLYYKEENELTNLLVSHKNKIRDRKFFIIQ